MTTKHDAKQDEQADGTKAERETPTAHICWACGRQYELKPGEVNVGRCTPCYVDDKL